MVCRIISFAPVEASVKPAPCNKGVVTLVLNVPVEPVNNVAAAVPMVPVVVIVSLPTLMLPKFAAILPASSTPVPVMPV